MRHATLLRLGVLLIALCALAGAHRDPRPSIHDARPNIIVILVDDLGYGDLSCYGSQTARTPAIDRIARDGIKLDRCYAQPVCGPSRSALLTGRHPHLSLGWNMPASEITIAELLAGAGYRTGCVGKWDVSSRLPIINRMPLAQGFDYYYGTLGGNDSGQVDLYEGNDLVEATDDMTRITGLFTDKAMKFVESAARGPDPFFLYLCHSMPHNIIAASDSFRGSSQGGLYGDVIQELDHHTGRLLDSLDELGIADNTLVILLSDNGAWNQPSYLQSVSHLYGPGTTFWGSSGPLRNGKGSPFEGGSRVPCVMKWPSAIPAARVSDAIVSSVDFLPTFAALAGYSVPQDRTINGIDQTDLLTGVRDDGRGSLVVVGNGVIFGDWKYLVRPSQRFEPGYSMEPGLPDVEALYDLSVDPSEQYNLAALYPERVARMSELAIVLHQGH